MLAKEMGGTQEHFGLTEVQKTALITLQSRVLEAKAKNPIVWDPFAIVCLKRILTQLPDNTREEVTERTLPISLTRYIIHRTRKYDNEINTFIGAHQNPVVVNLGCGFDTRFWRIDNSSCTYLELDLPEIIQMKKAALEQFIDYKFISSCITEHDWIERVARLSKKHVLLVAEGVFMYLEEAEVMKLFRRFAETFEDSMIIFENVSERYTKGIWRRVVTAKINRSTGTNAGSFYRFGLRRADQLLDIDGYGNICEWSYLEDQDLKPGILTQLKYFKLFSRSQWTIMASINGEVK